MQTDRTKLRWTIPLGCVLMFALACEQFASTSPKTVKSDDGVSAVTVPSDWRTKEDLNDTAVIRVANLWRETYLIVITERKEGLDFNTIDAHSALTRKDLLASLKGATTQNEKRFAINGLPALQYEIRGDSDGVEVVFLHTSVEGRKHFHYLLAWTLKSKVAKTRATLDSAIGSFREVGRDGKSVPPPPPPRFGTPTHYDRKAAQASYSKQRKELETKLVSPGPAPGEWTRRKPPRGFKAVGYRSGNLKLKAWLSKPAKRKKSPALVYFHDGFALDASTANAARPFVEAGLVVMIPMLRGENGNPGRFELFLGEIDDAEAAVKWLAKRRFVDRDRIYAFGDGVGGGITALLSTVDDLPLRHGASADGLFTSDIFVEWGDVVPFDTNAEEKRMRVLLGNIGVMRRPHHAYVGMPAFERSVLIAAGEGSALAARNYVAPLYVKALSGLDHERVREAATAAYVAMIVQDAGKK